MICMRLVCRVSRWFRDPELVRQQLPTHIFCARRLQKRANVTYPDVLPVEYIAERYHGALTPDLLTY